MRHARSTLARILANVAISLIGLALFLMIGPTAQAQSAVAHPPATFSVLHNFTGGLDGANPEAGLTLDRAGNLYGTAFNGGSGFGTAFKLANKNGSWLFAPLHSFAGGADGANPTSRIAIASDGSLYGTTSDAGTGSCNSGQHAGCGTVFHLRPPATFARTPLTPWTETVLYSFTGSSDGGDPLGSLRLIRQGTFTVAPCKEVLVAVPAGA